MLISSSSLPFRVVIAHAYWQLFRAASPGYQSRLSTEQARGEDRRGFAHRRESLARNSLYELRAGRRLLLNRLGEFLEKSALDQPSSGGESVREPVQQHQRAGDEAEVGWNLPDLVLSQNFEADRKFKLRFPWVR
jgi:hypothetical protein